MVAYSFQPRFAPLIREGLKLQTIQGSRARHARPGERLQLFTGLRTRHAMKIVDDPVCVTVSRCDITFASGRIGRIVVAGIPVRDLDMFASLDGFEDRDDMSAFWRERHGAIAFSGVLIEWSHPRSDIETLPWRPAREAMPA